MWQEWIVTDCVSDLTDTTRYRDGYATISPSFFIICHPCIQMYVHMSVITQSEESPLMKAAKWGRTEVVSLLVKAGAALDLQDKVNM